MTWKIVLLSAVLTLCAYSVQPVRLLSSVPSVRADETGTVSDSATVGEANAPLNSQPLHSAPASGTGVDAGGALPTNESEHSGGHEGGHQDPVAEVLLAITIVLLAAKGAGELFERVHMPAVLGELTVGILLGNWALLTGMETVTFLKPSAGHPEAMTGNVLDMLSRIGVVLLLFEVGLETRVRDMMSVGVSSLVVAVLGVIAPMILGFIVGYLLLSDSIADWQVPAFLGATLCATSVGITARVIKDMGRSSDRESRIILGAAVIDDVLGLIVLAVVSGVIKEGADFDAFSLFKTVGLSFGFLAVALTLGAVQLPRAMFRMASFLQGQGMLIVTALVICFTFSWAASEIGLAPIIGAFAAGLILEGTHYQDVSEKWTHHHLEDSLAPLATLMVPIFFVAMGMSVDLSAFANSSVWLLATGLTVAAIIGKLACCFGILDKGLNRLAVGLGMIPRGEVGLIFAAEGARLLTAEGTPVIDRNTNSAIVVMVMITTMVTPPLLKWAMSRPPQKATASLDKAS